MPFKTLFWGAKRHNDQRRAEPAQEQGQGEDPQNLRVAALGFREFRASLGFRV